ncbi:MAG: hypothetical protein IJ890_05640 [Clostridia bacterium]|nr:hypothetical protein [Clostridia bacterium]
MENTLEKKEQVTNLEKEQQLKKPKCCPFLTIPVMMTNKFTQKQEAQLKINACIEDNCAIYNSTIKRCNFSK